MTARFAVHVCRSFRQTSAKEESAVIPGRKVRAAGGQQQEPSAEIRNSPPGMKFAHLSIPDGRQQTAVARRRRKFVTERFCMESVMCDQCGGGEHSPHLTMEDHLFHVPGTFSIVQCASCGLLYTNPRPTGIELHELYATHYETNARPCSSTGAAPFMRRHPGMLTLWHALCGQYSSAAIRKMKGNVLDIGCGTGDLLEQARMRGCRAYGVEPNAVSAELCRRNGFDVCTGSFEDLPFSADFFDSVVLWHSIEHLSSPRNALAKIKRILKPDGRVLIWCPNADSSPAALFHKFWFGWHLPFHFYHFTPTTIRALAETTGFRVEKLRAVTPEFVFAYSLQAWMKHRKGRISQSAGWIRLLRTCVARAMIALVFRIHDHALKGKGEYLQVELVPVTE